MPREAPTVIPKLQRSPTSLDYKMPDKLFDKTSIENPFHRFYRKVVEDLHPDSPLLAQPKCLLPTEGYEEDWLHYEDNLTDDDEYWN